MGEIGFRLVRAREARGLTLEDAERDTRISRRYLEALEAEQFEVIPAPVYARGFLRSYSQYLGMDPAEMLALFPRDAEGNPTAPPPMANGSRPPASTRTPIPAQGASRPNWNRGPGGRDPVQPLPPRPRPPAPQVPVQQQAPRPRRREDPPPMAPVQRPTPPPATRGSDDFIIGGGPSVPIAPPEEPMIGIDLGVGTPARRINPDPASNSRALLLLGLAGGAIIAILLVAWLISRAGDDNAPGTGGSPTAGAGTANAPAQPTPTPTTATGPQARRTVPDLQGLTSERARELAESAGYVVVVKEDTSVTPRGQVITQSPAPGIELAAGGQVTIVVSTGP